MNSLKFTNQNCTHAEIYLKFGKNQGFVKAWQKHLELILQELPCLLLYKPHLAYKPHIAYKEG